MVVPDLLPPPEMDRSKENLIELLKACSYHLEHVSDHPYCYCAPILHQTVAALHDYTGKKMSLLHHSSTSKSPNENPELEGVSSTSSSSSLLDETDSDEAVIVEDASADEQEGNFNMSMHGKHSTTKEAEQGGKEDDTKAARIDNRKPHNRDDTVREFRQFQAQLDQQLAPPTPTTGRKKRRRPSRYQVRFNGHHIYEWSQTHHEVQLFVPAPPTCMTLAVVCNITNMKVQLGRQSTGSCRWFLNNETGGPVRASESFWSEEGDMIAITLIKESPGAMWAEALSDEREGITQRPALSHQTQSSQGSLLGSYPALKLPIQSNDRKPEVGRRKTPGRSQSQQLGVLSNVTQSQNKQRGGERLGTSRNGNDIASPIQHRRLPRPSASSSLSFYWKKENPTTPANTNSSSIVVSSTPMSTASQTYALRTWRRRFFVLFTRRKNSKNNKKRFLRRTQRQKEEKECTVENENSPSHAPKPRLGSGEELQSGGRLDNDKATRHSYKSRKELQQEMCQFQMEMEKRLDRFRSILSFEKEARRGLASNDLTAASF